MIWWTEQDSCAFRVKIAEVQYSPLTAKSINYNWLQKRSKHQDNSFTRCARHWNAYFCIYWQINQIFSVFFPSFFINRSSIVIQNLSHTIIHCLFTKNLFIFLYRSIAWKAIAWRRKKYECKIIDFLCKKFWNSEFRMKIVSESKPKFAWAHWIGWTHLTNCRKMIWILVHFFVW